MAWAKGKNCEMWIFIGLSWTNPSIYINKGLIVFKILNGAVAKYYDSLFNMKHYYQIADTVSSNPIPSSVGILKVSPKRVK